jgi:hypothetical protein
LGTLSGEGGAENCAAASSLNTMETEGQSMTNGESQPHPTTQGRCPAAHSLWRQS